MCSMRARSWRVVREHAHLAARERARAAPEALDRHGEERDRLVLAHRDELVVLAPVRLLAAELAGEGDESVRLAGHGRHHDDDPVAGVEGPHGAAGDVPDPLRVADARPAVLLDDQHGAPRPRPRGRDPRVVRSGRGVCQENAGCLAPGPPALEERRRRRTEGPRLELPLALPCGDPRQAQLEALRRELPGPAVRPLHEEQGPRREPVEPAGRLELGRALDPEEVRVDEPEPAGRVELVGDGEGRAREEIRGIPSPSATPFAKTVFPAPSSPVRATTAPAGPTSSASSRPAARVSAGPRERQRIDTSGPRPWAERAAGRVPEPLGHRGKGARDLARQGAGGAPGADRQSAARPWR